MTARIENLLTTLAVTLLVAILYFTSPSLFQAIDYVLFYRPNFQFLVDSIHGGELPLWNPYLGLGRPYLADLQNAVFYPPIYLLLLGEGVGLAMLVWSHCLLAVIGMRTLGRALGMTRGISVFIAFSFVASIALTGRMFAGQVLYVCAACYLPWLLWMSLPVENPLNRRRVATHAALLALQFLCGHPQIFWLSGLAQVALIFGGAMRSSTGSSLRALIRGLGALALAGSLAVGVVAVVLLPFLELIPQGNRVAPSLAFASYGRLAWPELMTLFLRSPYPYLVDWERHLFMGLPLAMAGLAGLTQIRNQRQRPLLVLAIAGLLLAVADSTPLGAVFYKVLPGYSVFRLHARAGLLIVMALLLAAGIWLSEEKYGRQAWAGLGIAGTLILGLILFFAPESKEGFPLTSLPALTTMVTIVLLAVWLWAGTSRPQLGPLALLAFTLVQVINLANENYRVKGAYSFFNSMRSTGHYPTEGAMTRALESAGLLRPGLPPPRVLADKHVIPPNFGMMHGYSSVDGYTSLFLGRPWKFLHGVAGVAEDEAKNTALSPDIADKAAFPIPGFHQIVGLDPLKRVIQMTTNPPPRAFVVFAAQTVPSLTDQVNRLRSGHDIYRTALIESSSGALPEVLNPPAAVPVTVERFERNRLVIEVDIPRDGLLVLAEAWYPGWRLKLGDRLIESAPVNVWMRSFPVPAGKYSAEIVFHQNRLLPGAVISGLSLILLCFLLRRKPATK
ncbi:MAG: hypothetical protein H7X97_06060 [Opitutaceae bacterium]|nr:hypothetical protein [Verrucomicrobiales bacterium]